MIKKYFKLLLFGFLFVLFGFTNFSNGASWSIHQNGVYFPSPLENSLELNVVSKGQLMTQRFGNTKRLLSLVSSMNSNNANERLFFMWGENQRPYLYYQYHSTLRQGYYKNYYICPFSDIDLMSGLDYNFAGCSQYNLDDTFSTVVGSFFDTINNSDYWGYYFQTGTCDSLYSTRLYICFSNSTLDSTICFANGQSTCSNYFNNNLTGSVGFASGLDFTSIPDSFLNTPPGFKNNIQGSSGQANNTTVTGNNMYQTCTNGFIVNYYFSRIDPDDICYAGSNDMTILDNDTFTGIQYIATGMTYKDLFSQTKDWYNWSDWYRNYEAEMLAYKLGQSNGYNVFSGRPVALYSYFSRLWTLGFLNGNSSSDDYIGMQGPNFIYNFCSLYLYSDYQAEYKGSFFSPLCHEQGNSLGGLANYVSGAVAGGQGGGSLDGTGGNTDNNVNVSVSRNGVLSGEVNQNFDGKTFISNYFTKLQNNFQNPVGSLFGIIPGYIIVFMLALILFRFLQH